MSTTTDDRPSSPLPPLADCSDCGEPLDTGRVFGMCRACAMIRNHARRARKVSPPRCLVCRRREEFCVCADLRGGRT